ncbi:MAG TPA: hypothetical protein QGI22_01175 [Candidatus Woesearchaeota archaeon]|jgi:hypothetical protein|nr:hypothetical protein [Candidatus Woesearchaeota archaeon]HJN56557.1 hypothetical protein [Candidatus Woesearchaeota archaeon]|tara:strand:+ start:40775 stop:42166 length:1392 start_codon:yes stop_codon:yes gene_type:complete
MNKKILVFLILVLIPSAFALNTGVIVDIGGDVHEGCVLMESGDSAYDLLKEFDDQNDEIDIDFDGVITNTPFLKSVNGLEGKSLGDNKFSGWNFWISGNDNSFDDPPEIAPEWGMGIGDYKIEKENDIIAVNFGITEFNSDWTVKNMADKPDFIKYSKLCELLNVKDIKVYVDGKKENSADEDGGKIDAVPGSKIKLKIDIENLDDNIDIEEITVEGTLEDIDIGLDLEDEADEFKINSGKNKDVSLEFNIPLAAEEDDYDLTLEIEGENEFNVPYSISTNFEVEIKKEKHNLIFDEITSDNNILCNSQAQLKIKLANIGKEKENIELTILNEELKINTKENIILNIGKTFEKTYSLQIPKDKSGTFPIIISAAYNNGNDNEAITKEINVNCHSELSAKVSTKNNQNKITGASTFALQTEQIKTEPVTDKKSFFEEYKLILILAGFNLIMLSALISLIIKFLV